MDKKLEHYKKLLLDEKKNLEKTLNLMEENDPNTSLPQYYDELSSYDNHPADVGSETFQIEMDMNLKNNEKVGIQEVDLALERIENGTYGDCMICGKKIDEDRLEVLPSSVICMACEKESIPIEDQIHTRPVEEEVLGVPFSSSFMDNRDYNGFDGEDSWQAVARYNKTSENAKALDWYDNNMYDETPHGIVEEVDAISNEHYEDQLPDANIPKKKNKNKDNKQNLF